MDDGESLLLYDKPNLFKHRLSTNSNSLIDYRIADLSVSLN